MQDLIFSDFTCVGICYPAAHIECSHSEGSSLLFIVGHEDSKAAEVLLMSVVPTILQPLVAW